MLVSRSRSLRRMWRGTALAASTIALGVLLASALPVAAASTPFGQNLVKNPGAEHGINNWDAFPDGAFTAHAYGPSGLGYPPKSEGTRINGGAHFFTSSEDIVLGCGEARQDIALQGIGGAIDKGHVKVVLKGYAATNGAAQMTARLDLQFFNSEHHTDNIASWGIKKHATGTHETYTALQGAKVLPKHTRMVQLHLWQTPNDGSVGCQSSWDR